MVLDKRKVLLGAVYGLGVLSAGVLFVAKCPYVRVMEEVCVDNSAYGNASIDAKLRPFDIRLPAPVGEGAPLTPPGPTDGYRLFLLGDSFLGFNRGHESLAHVLSRSLGESAHITSWSGAGPECLFRRETPGPRAGPRRVVVLERTEWHLTELALTASCPPLPEAAGPVGRRAQKLFDAVFSDSEERLRYLLYNSVLTAPVVEAWNTFLYERFGVLPAGAPIASVSPPYLFSRVETDPNYPSSFYAVHDDALVAAIADNAAKWAERLRSDYGAELILAPVPSRYTLYHRFARPNDAYDEFLPRLYKELARRKVAYVDLYTPLTASSEPAYFPTDVHWNGRGIDVASAAIARAVRSAGERP